MRHLGQERVYSLELDGCYWPLMSMDIECCVTKASRFVKQKRPVFKSKELSFTHHFNSTFWPNFDKFSSFRSELRRMPVHNVNCGPLCQVCIRLCYIYSLNLDRLQQKNCLLSISHDLDSKAKLFMSREGNLKKDVQVT